MDNVLDTNFSKAFAIAWNENQGGYSEGIAKKTLSFAKNQEMVSIMKFKKMIGVHIFLIVKICV